MKKIALIVFNYYLANSLSLISSATILAREGYDVHIFIDRFTYERSKANFAEEHISVHPIDIQADARADDITNKTKSKRWRTFFADNLVDLRDKRWGSRNSVLFDLYRVLYRTLRTLKSKPTHVIQSLRYSFHARAVSIPSINTVEIYTSRFFPSLAEFHQKVADHIDDDYICLVGVEPQGLIAATLAANASKHEKTIPVIYYNQELLLERDCHTFESKTLKALERICNQACSFTIIQDKRRAKYLCDDNNLESESIICVPVSGLEKAYHKKGSLLQDMYGIPREKRILLYAGNMSSWAMCVEIAQAAQTWKDDFVLVLHSWREDMKNDPYVSRIRRLTENKKVYLSLMQVDWQKMPDLLSSADIGLVFYQNLGVNFYETGHSSNKLAQYLQAGLPLIASDFPSLRDVIDKYQCGEYGNGPEDIEHLAEKIFHDYENYRANAFRCYENEYDFSKYFKKVVERIKEIEVPSC
jgi:glycosyltransferase involved in cell wall biosynthesis